VKRKEAEAAVDAIFADLRDRRFLKWLFDPDPENMGPILHNKNGEPLMALDRGVQAEIREAWISILVAGGRVRDEGGHAK